MRMDSASVRSAIFATCEEVCAQCTFVTFILCTRTWRECERQSARLIQVVFERSPNCQYFTLCACFVFLIRIQSGQWIRIRIQEGNNDLPKWKNLRNFLFWSSGCSLLRAEGLDVLYGGLLQKISIFFSAANFVKFLVIKTLDPYRIRIGGCALQWRLASLRKPATT